MHKALIALIVAPLPSSALADTLIYNVNGIEVGADAKFERFTGLLIDDKGKVIRKTETIEEAFSPRVFVGPRGNWIDMGGRTLLPGLIDAHGHVVDSPGGDMGLGLMLIQLDVAGTISIAALQQRLRRYAAENPGNTWILGRGWNQELWPDKRMPTAADLDAVVRDRPVILTRVDGHAAVANSAALKLAEFVR